MSQTKIRIKCLVTSDADEGRVHDRLTVAGAMIVSGRIAEEIAAIDDLVPGVQATDYLDLGQDASVIVGPNADLVAQLADAIDEAAIPGVTVLNASASVLGFFSHVLRVGIDRPLTIYMIDHVIVSPLEFGEALELIANEKQAA